MHIRILARATAAAGAVLAIVVSVSSCGLSDRAAPAEDRINRAFPQQEAARVQLDSLQAVRKEAGADDAQAFERELAAKQKIRALECAGGYTPRWMESEADIRTEVKNDACFAEQDAQIARWASLRRVGALLAMPPLRKVPEQIPAAINARQFISQAKFARAAGVALLATRSEVLLVDMATDQVISNSPAEGPVGEVSPNGRVFVAGPAGNAQLRDTVTGQTLLSFPKVHTHQFFWLDAGRAVHGESNTGNLTLVDFDAGVEIPLEMVRGGLTRAAAIPGRPNDYVLFQFNTITEIGVTREGAEVRVRVLEQQPCETCAFSLNTSDPTADGEGWTTTVQQRGLAFVALDPLRIARVDFAPLRILQMTGTPGSGRVLMYVWPSGATPEWVWYSRRDDRFDVVDKARIPGGERFEFCPSLPAVAVIADSRVVFLKDLPVSTIANREQYFASVQARVDEAKRTAASARAQTIIDGPIRRLAQGARLEAVGVYEGTTLSKRMAGAPSSPGAVTVIVRRSSAPILLLLTSYRGVTWNLVVSPGAQLRGILKSGYEDSTILGAGTIPVFSIGHEHAYSSGHSALQDAAYRNTGLDIANFQGSYTGKTFMVGGD